MIAWHVYDNVSSSTYSHDRAKQTQVLLAEVRRSTQYFLTLRERPMGGKYTE